MINFTGQSRKRVVNLGDKRPNSLLNSKGYLERSKAQRQQREEQRIKEKNCRLIQSYIVKYLATRRQADQLFINWRDKRVTCQSEFDVFVVDFSYLTVWKITYDLDVIDGSLAAVCETIKSYEVSAFTGKLLLQSMVEIARKVHLPSMAKGGGGEGEGTKTEVAKTETVAKLVALTSIVLQKVQYTIPCGGLISTFAPFVDVPSVADQVNDLVMKVNVKDSYLSFLKYVSLQTSFSGQHLQILKKVVRSKPADGAIQRLGDDRKISLLSLFLQSQNDQTWLIDDYKSIGKILSTITFSVRTIDETRMTDDSDDEPAPGDGSFVEIDSKSFENIRILYGNKFIMNMFELFTGSVVESSRLAIKIMSALFRLIPEYKTKLCMLITITTGSYRSFYTQLQNDPIYKAIASVNDQDRDYIRSSDLNNLYSQLGNGSVTGFWKTLYTFEELYSYWLIVSHDFESFEDDKLSLQEISDLLVFLKSLCLTLILNPQQDQIEDYGKLKDVSVSLLNQLYLKNLRLKFLPEDFWSLGEIKFNIDSLIQVVAEEEEKSLIEDEDDPRPAKKTKASEDTIAKLEILNKVPFFIKFNDRVLIFQSLIDLDLERQERDFSFQHFGQQPALRGKIRREHLLEDAFDSFGKIGTAFKDRIGVSFYNEYGGKEAGIDGGGITKEFLSSVVTEAFNPEGKYHLFKETSDNQVYPSEDLFVKYSHHIDAEEVERDLEYLRFLGSIVGKCLYERVLIDISFAPFFLNKWCNSRNTMKNSLNDLNSLDKELFQNLMKLTKMSNKDLEDLDLTFSVNVRLDDHSNFQFDLAENGDKVKVNGSNILNYIHQMANFKLNTSLHIQSKKFLEGLFEIISSSWLKMFDFNELQMLISGSESNIDVEDWKNNVSYGGYLEDDITIRYFWEIIEEMSASERSKLVKFVSSVSRAPLLGFGALNPLFGIRNSGGSKDRLPTASTCINLLKLPDYQDKEILREKLLYSINAKSFFDLS